MSNAKPDAQGLATVDPIFTGIPHEQMAVLMLTEVRHAILPLALRNRHGGDELKRAVLLIESLARHWLDRKPLQLLIVSPQRDVDMVRVRLPAFSNIEISVHGEREFFPRFSRFYTMPGWYRQQMVPATLRFGGYLTLDSDVFCVDDFDASTFIEDGRALSRWEPKRQHDWWRHAAEYVGVPYDAAAHGLSVTPNILHGDLARQVVEHVGRGVFDWQTALALRLLRKTRADLHGAVMEGAVERVRPKMMTVTAIVAGLLPILWNEGTGSEVMQRIAVPMIGGMASSALLTLLVIPAIYALAKGWLLRGGQSPICGLWDRPQKNCPRLRTDPTSQINIRG